MDSKLICLVSINFDKRSVGFTSRPSTAIWDAMTYGIVLANSNDRSESNNGRVIDSLQSQFNFAGSGNKREISQD